MLVITGVTRHTGRAVAARLRDEGRPVWVVGRSLWGGCGRSSSGEPSRSWPTRRTARPQLFGTIEQIKENPEIAQFKFRTINTWIDGTHNRATVKDFYSALKEDTSREQVAFEIDEPPVLCGQNLGANPVEYLLLDFGHSEWARG